MATVKIPPMPAYRFGAACTGCGACLLTCPQHAIRPGRAGQSAPLYVLTERCDGCGECIEICPADAITEEWLPHP
jgi:NAD-dependent dihydropyrimidine dehydrogenase PreA subunit